MTQKLQNHLEEIKVKLKVVNVSEIIRRTINLNEPLFSFKGIRLQVSGHDEVLMCPMDMVHMTEVRNSLIRNSLEAMQKRGANCA